MSGAGTGLIQQPILVGLLYHPVHGHWLIDTGVHPRLKSQNWLTRLFLKVSRLHIPEGPLPVPRQLSGLFLSHFHLDHAAGLKDFPGLPVATSRTGYEWAQKPAGWRSGWCNSLMPDDLGRRALWLEDLPQRQYERVRGGDLFGDGSVLAVPLPGHCPGQHGLLCQTEAGRVFFVADAAGHSAILTEGRSQRLPTLFAADLPAERRTRCFLRSLKDWCRLIPSHCPEAYVNHRLTLRHALDPDPPAL